jgi:hypothetical protein
MPIFYYFVGLLLQALPTREGWQYLKGASGDDAEKADFSKQHLSTDEFHKKFYESDLGQDIRERLDAPGGEAPATLKSLAKVRFQNSWYQSLKLLVQRETLLWWRDKYQIQAKLGKFPSQSCTMTKRTLYSSLPSNLTPFCSAQTVVMGTVVGTLFFQVRRGGCRFASSCDQSSY